MGVQGVGSWTPQERQGGSWPLSPQPVAFRVGSGQLADPGGKTFSIFIHSCESHMRAKISSLWGVKSMT